MPRLLLLAGESARPVGLIEQLLAEKLGAHHSTHEVRQVLAKVKALAPTGRLGETGVIPLEETDLLVEVSSTGKVSFWSREPGPERLIGAQAQVPWRTGANRSALEEHLQRAVSSGEDRQVLQDYAGYSLLHWARPFSRALAVVGPEGSGAAPIMEALSRLCARVSSVRPSRLARGRSETLSPEAWANICHEADPEALARLPLLSGPVGTPPRRHSPRRALLRKLLRVVCAPRSTSVQSISTPWAVFRRSRLEIRSSAAFCL